jgi:hypothetical protein
MDETENVSPSCIYPDVTLHRVSADLSYCKYLSRLLISHDHSVDLPHEYSSTSSGSAVQRERTLVQTVDVDPKWITMGNFENEPCTGCYTLLQHHVY